jgi:hypothetical protein
MDALPPVRSRNPGVRTIEEELLEAMSKAAAFPPDMKNDLSKVSQCHVSSVLNGSHSGIWLCREWYLALLMPGSGVLVVS